MDEIKEKVKEKKSSPEKTGALPAADKKETKKRASKLHRELEALRNENKQLKDQLLRKMAEFENFRKRTDKEVVQIITRASEALVVRLLPVIDDLERSLEQPADIEHVQAIHEGIELIYNKFLKTLEDAGLKLMETDSRKFDPEIHDALMQAESDDIPSNHIIQTFEKGYYFNGKVIRHAKVSVSK